MGLTRLRKATRHGIFKVPRKSKGALKRPGAHSTEMTGCLFHDL
jgi:hypothetical protein